LMTVHDVWPTKGIFWMFCAPTTLWILIRQQGYLDLWRSKPMRWAFGILLLYLISVYWSEPTTGYYQGKIQRHTLQTWLFVVALFFAFKDRKSTRLNSSHVSISYAVFCLKKKRNTK